MAYIQGPVRNQDILSFWNRHRVQIYKLCSLKMNRSDSISDVMQDVYIRLHTHFEEVICSEKPLSWLFKVTENVCQDEFRRLRREGSVCKNFFRYSVKHVEKFRKELETEYQLNAFLDSLSPRLGTLVELHYLKGFSIGELSEISGTCRSTVAKHLVQSLSKMRKKASEPVKVS